MDDKKQYDIKLFLIGLALLVVGTLALLVTTGRLPRVENLWPLVLVVAGFVLLYLYVRRGQPKKFIYMGLFGILSGSFTQILLAVKIPGFIEKVWPLYLAFGGISFIPYSFRKKPSSRMSYFIAGLAMIFIALFFLLFSLKIIDMRFRQFVRIWWPLLILGMGLFLTGVSFIRQKDVRLRGLSKILQKESLDEEGNYPGEEDKDSLSSSDKTDS